MAQESMKNRSFWPPPPGNQFDTLKSLLTDCFYPIRLAGVWVDGTYERDVVVGLRREGEKRAERQ